MPRNMPWCERYLREFKDIRESLVVCWIKNHHQSFSVPNIHSKLHT